MAFPRSSGDCWRRPDQSNGESCIRWSGTRAPMRGFKKMYIPAPPRDPMTPFYLFADMVHLNTASVQRTHT